MRWYENSFIPAPDFAVGVGPDAYEYRADYDSLSSPAEGGVTEIQTTVMLFDSWGSDVALWI